MSRALLAQLQAKQHFPGYSNSCFVELKRESGHGTHGPTHSAAQSLHKRSYNGPPTLVVNPRPLAAKECSEDNPDDLST